MSNQPPHLSVVPDEARSDADRSALHLALMVAMAIGAYELSAEVVQISKHPGEWPSFLNNLLAILRDQPTDPDSLNRHAQMLRATFEGQGPYSGG